MMNFKTGDMERVINFNINTQIQIKGFAKVLDFYNHIIETLPEDLYLSYSQFSRRISLEAKSDLNNTLSHTFLAWLCEHEFDCTIAELFDPTDYDNYLAMENQKTPMSCDVGRKRPGSLHLQDWC